MFEHKAKLLFLSIFVLAIFDIPEVKADKVCLRINNNGTKLVRRIVTSGNCPKRFTQIVDTSILTGPTGSMGPTGAQGPQGSQGEDGVFRVWGDGSAGAQNITTSTTINNLNNQYTNFTIANGATVAVFSGTIIRATGTCSINGSLVVQESSLGGRLSGPLSAATIVPAFRPPSIGRARSIAGFGEIGNDSDLIYGGFGGDSIAAFELRASFPVSISNYGGGSGAGSTDREGGSGGGSIALYCKDGITIGSTSIVQAIGGAGSTGSGGGAGGFIFLASATTISNQGSLNAYGGEGGGSNFLRGAGGGGGGGLIRMIAPQISNTGTTDVSGGTAGSNVVAVSNSPRIAGAGGGGFAGKGGDGGSVQSSGSGNVAEAAEDGLVGLVIQTLADPTSLLL